MKNLTKVVKIISRKSLLLLCFLSLWPSIASANTNLTLDILGEEFTLQHFPAAGTQLVLYIAPGYGFNGRGTSTSQALSELGIEVWMVDLVDNLFLPQGNQSIRAFDGRYVAKIIEIAHKKTGKNITLLSSSFGAIPVLRGARQWQLNNHKLEKAYLNGAILFSPELYTSIPALGVDPDFEPITSATNIPIMIYQSEFRNNRWQLDNVIERLEKNNAHVYRKILHGIVSFFYEIDTFPNTLKTLRELPAEIPNIINLLESTPTPLIASKIDESSEKKYVGIDIKLKSYKGEGVPLPLNLKNMADERFVRNHYTNKVTVVNFWATWCPPCVVEIPSLNRLKTKMKGSNFELISINFGQQKTTISEFLKKVNVEFPVLLDEAGRTSGDWNTISLPSTYVIGPDGKFAYAVNAAIEWDNPEVINTLKKLSRQ